jgi:serine/threonine-protein phosphatase PP1 catalytic subunit
MSVSNSEFDNYGACMRFVVSIIAVPRPGYQLWSHSVSEDLLCAFELLKPLDGPALRKEMTKAKRKR